MNNQNLQTKLQQIILLAEGCKAFLNGQNSFKKSVGKLKPLSKALKNEQPQEKINFNLNSRRFFKNYAKGLSGPKKFTLIVAYLSKGRLTQSVKNKDISVCWNKHAAFLGSKLTSRMYGTRAKENGWLDPSKLGFYNLTSEWKQIFN